MYMLWILVVIYAGINRGSVAVLAKTVDKSPCTSCIHCLNHQNEANIKIGSQRTSIDRGECPKSDTEEFYTLQQIEFMFKGHNKKAPCVKYCGRCRKSILKVCRWFKRMNKSAWDTMYDGIFNMNFSSDAEHNSISGSKSKGSAPSSSDSSPGSESSDVKSDYTSKGKELPSRKVTELRASELGCCEFSTSIVPYMGVKQDGGVTWYAVWFKNPLLSYQLSQEATCSSHCSLVNTSRTFLFTSVPPHPQYGHAFMLFSYHNSNIKFFNDYVPGYCKKQNL